MDIVITKGQYKSIGPLSWRRIPPFALLTGLNGSGKSQLLEYLYRKLTSSLVGQWDLDEALRNTHLEIMDDHFEPHDVSYSVSEWGVFGGTVDLTQLQQSQRQLFDSLMADDQPEHVLLRRKLEEVVGKPVHLMSKQEFDAALPQDYRMMIGSPGMGDALSHAFLSYRIAAADKVATGMSPEHVSTLLGPPPWEVLNSILEASELPYRVTDPRGQSLFADYQLKLCDTQRQVTLDPGTLSSGEKIMVGVLMWLFRSRRQYGLPRLLLLDEPDAHLHPSMVRQFLDVVLEVLVEKHGMVKCRFVCSFSSGAAEAQALFLSSGSDCGASGIAR